MLRIIVVTRILITGAAGRIGTVLKQKLANHYDLVLADMIRLMILLVAQ